VQFPPPPLLAGIDVPGPGEGALSFSLHYANYADQWYSQPYLDYVGRPNQQVRIDLMKDGSSPLSASEDDILLPILRTQPGDPLTLTWTSFVVDITPALLGPSVRFFERIAVVTTEDFAIVATRDQRLDVLLIPEPAAYHLLAAGLAATALVAIRRRHTRVAAM
jgi:hypothetical protein